MLCEGLTRQTFTVTFHVPSSSRPRRQEPKPTQPCPYAAGALAEERPGNAQERTSAFEKWARGNMGVLQTVLSPFLKVWICHETSGETWAREASTLSAGARGRWRCHVTETRSKLPVEATRGAGERTGGTPGRGKGGGEFRRWERAWSH